MTTTLASPDWIPRRDRHQDTVAKLLGPYLRQRANGSSNPVVDFLFIYYNLTPGQLRKWHPGFGVTLTGPQARDYEHLRGYCRTNTGVTVSREYLIRRKQTIDYVLGLMEATMSRLPSFGCFGMHEWAMVYRTQDAQLRHHLPLRLGHDGTDAVVESMPLRCTHFDAFRFFSDPARPRNATQLTRASQLTAEQPGCLHAGMDLYRFAAKLIPLVSSDLLMSTFELAYQARELDMRAGPYDLTGLGYQPVRIETPSGRAEYAREQAALAARAAHLRTTLHTRCAELLEAAQAP